jgi:hypothetical protein
MDDGKHSAEPREALMRAESLLSFVYSFLLG